MKAFFIFLIIPAAIALYFALAVGWGVYRRHPVVPYLAGALALAFLARELFVQFRWPTLIWTALGCLLITGFVWWTQVYSSYRPYRKPAASEEDWRSKLQSIQMRDSRAGDVNMGDLVQSSPATLLVFYRGFW